MISLLSQSYKMFTKILQKSIELREEKILNENRPVSGTEGEHGTKFFPSTEKMWERDMDMFCLFIDFEKALDSV